MCQQAFTTECLAFLGIATQRLSRLLGFALFALWSNILQDICGSFKGSLGLWEITLWDTCHPESRFRQYQIHGHARPSMWSYWLSLVLSCRSFVVSTHRMQQESLIAWSVRIFKIIRWQLSFSNFECNSNLFISGSHIFSRSMHRLHGCRA